MTDISRRKVLQAAGGVGIGASITTAIASGGGDRTPFCHDCPEGANLLAKYDWDDTTGFVFDVGECDAVAFTVNETNTDGEPVDVSWSSDLFYSGLHVKYSTNCDSFTREETRTDTNEKDGVYEGRVRKEDLEEGKAISYIAFCAAACFQVDFVFGDPIDDLGSDDGGFYSARKILHLWGNTFTGHTSGTQGHTETRNGCSVTTGSITTDPDNDTASVTFDVDGDSCKLSLVSYVAPCPTGFTKPTSDQQSRYDSESRTFSTSDDNTMTVDLPTAGDIGALCDEALDSVI